MNRNQPLDKRVESVLGRRNRNANLLSGKEPGLRGGKNRGTAIETPPHPPQGVGHGVF